MKFLVPTGGFVDSRFGIMTHPGHYGISAGIKSGMPWASDNQAFTGKFNALEYATWLKKFEPYRDSCLFVVIPDVVGDANKTLELYAKYRDNPMYDGWPVAFVAQDGQEYLPLPDYFDTLFIGGTTNWKVSQAAIECIKIAQALGKRIHIGRVNYGKRYNWFAGLPGSEDFTCDGTRVRYEGYKALRQWAQYMASPRQLHLPVSGGDCDG